MIDKKSNTPPRIIGPRVKIISGHDAVATRVFNKGKENQRESYSQEVYLLNGGAFPVKCKIPLQDPLNAYPVGEYEISAVSYQAGQYGDIELNRYDIQLLPIADQF